MPDQAAVHQSGNGLRDHGAGVFIGGSAGGIEVLAELLSRLSPDLAAPVLVVLHVGKSRTSVLPAILDRVGGMHAVTPDNGQALANGIVYVAPRGKHLLVDDGRVVLNEGPTEHGLRPAIDPLFRSAARTYGARAIGVIVSGMLDDGAAGLGEIRRRLRAAGRRACRPDRAARERAGSDRRRSTPGTVGRRALLVRARRTDAARDANRYHVPAVWRSAVGGG
jgi:chemotaxis response regulator CheB